MKQFNWRTEDILNSKLSDRYKDILLSELEGTMAYNDPSNTHKNIPSHWEFIKEFHEAMNELDALSSKMSDISLNECLHFKPDDELIINVPLRDLTKESLVSEVATFFDTLDDKEISRIIREIINPDNNRLRIGDYDENNPICEEVRGRCIKDNANNIVFASYYMKKNLADFTTLTHEIAHMLSAYLFGNDINPLIKNYLGETEAYYFELLSAYYIDKMLTKPEYLHIAFNMRLVKSIDYLWHIRKQYILASHLIKPRLKTLNKELKRLENASLLDERTYLELYRFKTAYINNMIHSFLAATDLFYQTVDDRRQGLKNFKDFMQSSRTTIEDLYSKSGITYLDDGCLNFHTLHEESKNLRKLVKK